MHKTTGEVLDPSLICGFCIQNSDFGSELQVSMGPTLPLVICPYETARLAPELLISMGPRPHLSFCASKTT